MTLVGYHFARSSIKLTYALYSGGISDAPKREIVDGIRPPDIGKEGEAKPLAGPLERTLLLSLTSRLSRTGWLSWCMSGIPSEEAKYLAVRA